MFQYGEQIRSSFLPALNAKRPEMIAAQDDLTSKPKIKMHILDLHLTLLGKNMPNPTEAAFAMFKTSRAEVHRWLIDYGYDWDLDVVMTDMEYDTGAATYRIALVLSDPSEVTHFMLRWG